MADDFNKRAYLDKHNEVNREQKTIRQALDDVITELTRLSPGHGQSAFAQYRMLASIPK